MCGSSWSRNWNNNTALSAEEVTSLDLVEAVEINMRRCDEGKITIHTDFRKEWEMVAADGLKESQLAGDRGLIFSRIIEIEN